MTDAPVPHQADSAPMTREELEKRVASAICRHTRMSPAVQFEIDLVMNAVDKHVELRLKEYFGNLVATYERAKMDLIDRELEIKKLRAEVASLRGAS